MQSHLDQQLIRETGNKESRGCGNFLTLLSDLAEPHCLYRGLERICQRFSFIETADGLFVVPCLFEQHSRSNVGGDVVRVDLEGGFGILESQFVKTLVAIRMRTSPQEILAGLYH